MVFVTHNRADFERLAAEYFTAGKAHAGILIATRRPAYEIARRLLTILNTFTPDELHDLVRYL
jgi:hypothetical protein